MVSRDTRNKPGNETNGNKTVATIFFKVSFFSREKRHLQSTAHIMFSFLAWFCSLPRTGKALVWISVVNVTNRMTLKRTKNENNKFNFGLPSVAQKPLCLSSLVCYCEDPEKAPRRPLLNQCLVLSTESITKGKLVTLLQVIGSLRFERYPYQGVSYSS